MRRLLVPVLLLAACGGQPTESAPPSQVYGQLCASCHAADLSGGIGPALGPDSAAVQLEDDALAHSIREGRGSGMPAFSRSLTEEQIEAMVAYLREQQGG